jgi:hypothetical protein
MPSSLQAIIASALSAAGTVCSISRAGAPVVVPGTTNYQPSAAIIAYANVPCRRVDSTSGEARKIDSAHESVDTKVVFYLPAVWQGGTLSLVPQQDTIIFESMIYDLIRVDQPSGGTGTGAQQSYTKCITRLQE